MRVAKVVEPDRMDELGGSCRGNPDVVAEPSPGDVSVGVYDAGSAGVVLTGGAPIGAVRRKLCLAVEAAASAHGVCGQGAMRVGPSAVVGFGSPGASVTSSLFP